MARRLSVNEKEEIVSSFTKGVRIEYLSEKFKCTKLTIIRNLKKNLGEGQYHNLVSKFKSLQDRNISKLSRQTNATIESFDNQFSLKENETKENFIEKSSDEGSFPANSFVEIAPLNYEIDLQSQKDLSSVPLTDVSLPNTVYMVVDKKIELETKLLKDYPDWHFLPEIDLNRKTLEIFSELKIAKKFCNKDQKVIKIPNSDVLRITSPILLARGISRIIISNQLIAL